MDSIQNTQSTNIEMVPRGSDDIYSYSNTAIPVSNPQNYIPQQYNNPDFQSQNYIPQQYNNNPDFQSQDIPYNSNQSQPDPNNPNQLNMTSNNNPKCGKTALLVMFVIQILFILIEIIVLSCIGLMGIIFIHIDEALVLGVAILFLIKYIDKCYMHPVVLTLMSVIVWFIGIPFRAISFSKGNFGILFPFMLLRIIILFVSIFISVATSPSAKSTGTTHHDRRRQQKSHFHQGKSNFRKNHFHHGKNRFHHRRKK